ncbi:MAG: serine hydrolase [Rhodospirillaceae bacterium]
MTYFPDADAGWERIAPADASMDATKLADAVAFVESHEVSWPRDIHRDGAIPSLTDLEPPPWNELLGPIEPRGGPNGLILKGGRIVASWGDPARSDMTFSVAKSYLSLLAGLAVADGLIGDIDAPVGATVATTELSAPRNGAVTWRHFLTQTSEWEGTLFGKPDLVDRNRQVGPGSDNSRKGQHRDLAAPGSYWEYNDVRVNMLALALLHVFKRPLPEVLAERIMAPIGASDTWTWHGYHNSFVEIDGRTLQSVPGGTHWGGGMHINSFDHARVGLLVLNGGRWRDRALLPATWIDQLRAPSTVRPGYGFLWWLNTDRAEWPAASPAAFAASGAGGNIIWLDPDHDLVVVARWMAEGTTADFLGRVTAAAG